jgi:hypothetical protein
MSQFDVHRNPSRSGREERPFVLIVQTRYLDYMSTRICAPLVAEGALKPFPKLNPIIRFDGQGYYFSPTEMITVPLRMLGKPLGNVESHRDRIVAALDFVFLGI